MNKPITLLTLFCFCFLGSFAQPMVEASLKPLVTTTVTCVKKDLDGGWVAGGISSESEGFASKSYFAKLDSTGALIFDTVYQNIAGEVEYISEIIPGLNGYTTITTVHYCCDCTAGGRIVGRKHNATGDVIFQKTLVFWDNEEYYSPLIESDSGIYISKGDSLFCFDLDLDPVWKISVFPLNVKKIIIRDTVLIASYADDNAIQRGLYFINKMTSSMIDSVSLSSSFNSSRFIFINDTLLITQMEDVLNKIDINSNTVVQSVLLPFPSYDLELLGKVDSGIIFSYEDLDDFSKLYYYDYNLQQGGSYSWENPSTDCRGIVEDDTLIIAFGTQKSGRFFNDGNAGIIKSFYDTLQTNPLIPDVGVIETILDSAQVTSFQHIAGTHILYYFKIKVSAKIHNFSATPVSSFTVSSFSNSTGICELPNVFSECLNTDLLPDEDTLVFVGWFYDVIVLPDTSTQTVYPLSRCTWTSSPNNKIDSFYFNDKSCNEVQLDIPVGINEQAIDKGMLSVFPNPSSGDFTVQFIQPGNGEYNFELTDVSGRMLESKTFLHDDKTVLIPNLKLAKGMYLVHILNETGRITKKVLVK